MMSNNTYTNSSAPSLAKAEELHEFESSFFPAGGAPQLANVPQAPPATNLNTVKSRPIHLKTRNWGNKLENGYSGLNRSLYDRPSSWDARPLLGERAHLVNNNNESFPSSSTSTTSTSRSLVDNIPVCPGVPSFRNFQNNLINGKRLRLRNWGYPSADGWSNINRDLYSSGMRLERDVLLNELRYKYGPRPNFQQQERSINTNVTNIVETVPTTTTALIETGPAKVLATTVPVPMLNPPINDGRRYAKLYKKNTNAIASEKGVARLVKRRGTRRDHLVQPNVAAAPSSFVAPYAGTIIQPATLVAETRTLLPATGVLPVAGTTLAPALTKAEMKREKRALKDQQRFVKKEQRAARKANKKNGGNLTQPIISAPILTTPITTAALPTASYVSPLDAGLIAPPTSTTLVGSPALQTAALPIAEPVTFVGETRSVLTQEATLLAPTSSVFTTGTPIVTPIGGVSAQPLDHAHVLAGQLGNAPVKRPRRARKAKKGTEQPLYSNIISTTPAPVTATTIATAPITTATTYTTSSLSEGTVVQPATLVSETRNIVVDPLVQQAMIKQEYSVAPAISPLATGNPIM